MKKEYCGMPMRIAHTGVTQFAPENSLEAFKKPPSLALRVLRCIFRFAQTVKSL